MGIAHLLPQLLPLLLVALSATSAAANSIHGCGGFVEASASLVKARKASDAKLDYSDIMVELQTVDGLVKDRTQCAPNGYYFIPVYDKGSFIVKVKGPDGWSWTPDSVPVVVDESGCNSNADINFQFTGFEISGQVKGAVGGESCSAKHEGPANVKVELLSPTGGLLSSTLTSDAGLYTFTNITPGRYQLRASHPDISIKIQGSSEVELGFGNIRVDDIFFVSGYDVHGFVVAQGNPILGVHIFIYSDDVLEVPCPQGHGNAPGQNNALCHAISDADGKFTFNSMPCGVYRLIPYYKGEDTIFDVSPPSVIVSVGHHNAMVEQKFQVTGFSVGGRVIDSHGAGIDDVDILLDGSRRATTDKQGYYKLDQVTSRKYTVGAQKRHYKFKSLENLLVLPNMAAIPDIEAASYDLCGVVYLISGRRQAKVALTHGPENAKPQMKNTDEKGNFCFEVLPGEYRLSALPANSEDYDKLLFSPAHIDLLVKSPVLSIEFCQAQVNIHGIVQCKKKCSPLISMSLVRLQDNVAEEKTTIYLGNENGAFMFSKVFPGKYQLEVKHVSSETDFEDDWCWERSVIDLNVATEDIEGITFVQKGYWINIISTHDVNVSIQQSDSLQRFLQIKRGSQRICVESSGHHELRFVDSCISFGSSSLEFNTLDSPVQPIYLTSEKYLLRGEIHIESNENDKSLWEHLVIDILNEDNRVVDTIPATLAPDESASALISVYKYTVWSVLGESMIFVPRDTRVTGDKKILFYPRKRHVSVVTDNCQDAVPPIIGRGGMYIEGSVSPDVSDVHIKIFATEISENAPLGKGELALEVRTGPDGYFRAGPLYDDTTYSVEASKTGYYLKAVGPSSFLCQKLSQISVQIYSGETGESLPSVLLSLSGDDGYRNNTVTGADGTFVFSNLFPGSFYLRPLLKEYSFHPATEAIELGSGEHKEMIFHSTRVAYSAFGTVSLLSGQPKEGVYLEARSESKGYYEETATDSFGNYRLRGLLPNTYYLVRVASKEHHGGAKIERSSPDSVMVEVGTKDIRGLDFIVFEQPEMTILSGHVEGNDLQQLQPYLSVEVRLASDPFKLSIVPLPLSCYFQIRDLPKEKHFLQLALQLPPTSHRFKSEPLEVDLALNPQKHVGPLRYNIEECQEKQEITPAPVYPFVIGVAIIVLLIGMPRLKDLMQPSFGASPSTTVTSSRKEARRPLHKRRL